MKTIISKFFIFIFIIIWTLFWSTTYAWTVSPPSCNWDSSIVNIYRSQPTAQIGDKVTFTVYVANEIGKGCDIINRTIDVELPDGSVETIGPFDSPFWTTNTLVGTFDYLTKKVDLVSHKWKTTIDWDWTLLDGFDSDSEWTKSTSVNYIPVDLDISKTVNPSYIEIYTWEINKQVSPASHELFYGQNSSSNYDVTVTKSDVVNSNYTVEWEIVINNPAEFASATIDSIEEGFSWAIIDCWTWVTFPWYSLPAWETLNCSYLVNLTDSGSTLNTVTVEVNLDSDVWWRVWTWAIDWWTAEVTTVNWTINVEDSVEWYLGSTSETHTFSYTKIFDCRDIVYEWLYWQKIYWNIATIVETKQSDEASVLVDCYKLDIEKTVNPSYTETYFWKINKSVDIAKHELFEGQNASSNYDVTVTKSDAVNSGYVVAGNIKISNPSESITWIIESVSDVLDDGTSATSIDCWVSLPYSLLAWETLNCSYVVNPTDNSSTLNTATVEIRWWVWWVWTWVVDWRTAQVTTVNWTINVEDSVEWYLGSTSETHTFSYTKEFDCRDIVYDWIYGQETYSNIATIVGTPLIDNASVIVDCYKPEVIKTVNSSIVEGYDWTIEKTVDVDNWDLFNWDSATSYYTISVNKNLTSTDYSVEWEITIKNTSDNLDLTIKSVDDLIDGWVVAIVDCGTLPTTILSWESLVCTYEASYLDWTEILNTATANFASNVNSASWSAAIDFTWVKPIIIGWKIDVDDTFDKWDRTWITNSISYNYTRKFICWNEEWEFTWIDNIVDNTATIVWTPLRDNASVEINCYDLEVSKSAETSYDRYYDWIIEKIGSITELTLNKWDSYTVDYDVTLTQSWYNDRNWYVAGEVIIVNNNPSRDAELKEILDELSIDWALDVDCPSLVIPAWEQLVCTYEKYISWPTEQINTSTVIQQNYEFDVTWGIDTLTTEYSWIADVRFWAPTNEYDTEVKVNDTLGWYLWIANISESPKTFEYPYEVMYDWEEVCWEHELDNIADYITNDTVKTWYDNWLIYITIECGCTYTQGYWKTHAIVGSKKYDKTWDLIEPNWPNTQFSSKFTDTRIKIFNTAPKGWNVWIQLAHQRMAAYLNSLNDASTVVLWNSLEKAWEWLMDNNPEDEINWKDLTQAKEWASLFADYNEWKIGPWHCDENDDDDFDDFNDDDEGNKWWKSKSKSKSKSK